MARQKNFSIKLQQAFVATVDGMIHSASGSVHEYIEKLRTQNPGITDDELARLVVRRKSLKNGLVGAATGLGGAITLPVAVPADLYGSWKIQIFMAMAVACVYGLDANASDLRTDIYLILAGDSAKEALKRAGIEISKGITKKAVQKLITRELMKTIWKVVPRKIITKAGEKSLTSFTKMIPLIGAPVGFTFDYFAARIVGRTAVRYYSGGG